MIINWIESICSIEITFQTLKVMYGVVFALISFDVH